MKDELILQLHIDKAICLPCTRVFEDFLKLVFFTRRSLNKFKLPLRLRIRAALFEHFQREPEGFQYAAGKGSCAADPAGAMYQQVLAGLKFFHGFADELIEGICISGNTKVGDGIRHAGYRESVVVDRLEVLRRLAVDLLLGGQADDLPYAAPLGFCKKTSQGLVAPGHAVEIQMARCMGFKFTQFHFTLSAPYCPIERPMAVDDASSFVAGEHVILGNHNEAGSIVYD